MLLVQIEFNVLVSGVETRNVKQKIRVIGMPCGNSCIQVNSAFIYSSASRGRFAGKFPRTFPLSRDRGMFAVNRAAAPGLPVPGP